MTYFGLKHLHMGVAVLSGSLFFLRGLMMLRESPWLHNAWLARGSYVIDTVLLASALTLMFWSAQYPFVLPWLTVKVVAVVAYIVAGAVALRRGKTKGIRISALVIALLTFGYIIKLAVTKQVF